MKTHGQYFTEAYIQTPLLTIAPHFGEVAANPILKVRFLYKTFSMSGL